MDEVNLRGIQGQRQLRDRARQQGADKRVFTALDILNPGHGKRSCWWKGGESGETNVQRRILNPMAQPMRSNPDLELKLTKRQQGDFSMPINLYETTLRIPGDLAYRFSALATAGGRSGRRHCYACPGPRGSRGRHFRAGGGNCRGARAESLLAGKAAAMRKGLETGRGRWVLALYDAPRKLQTREDAVELAGFKSGKPSAQSIRAGGAGDRRHRPLARMAEPGEIQSVGRRT